MPPLLRFLDPGTRFVEPCAGAGDLVDQLRRAGHVCISAFDIEPQRGDIGRGDATNLRLSNPGKTKFITNPPWTRSILFPLIRHLSAQAPTWMLLDAMLLFNDGFRPFLPITRKVVGTPRLIWIPGTTDTATDDTAWYLFDATIPPEEAVQFYGRSA